MNVHSCKFLILSVIFAPFITARYRYRVTHTHKKYVVIANWLAIVALNSLSPHTQARGHGAFSQSIYTSFANSKFNNCNQRLNINLPVPPTRLVAAEQDTINVAQTSDAANWLMHRVRQDISFSSTTRSDSSLLFYFLWFCLKCKFFYFSFWIEKFRLYSRYVSNGVHKQIEKCLCVCMRA